MQEVPTSSERGACPLRAPHLADASVPRATETPAARKACRLGMAAAATRTLAAFQSRNDQKLGTKLGVEEIRTKATECQGQPNTGSKYHEKMTRHGNDRPAVSSLSSDGGVLGSWGPAAPLSEGLLKPQASPHPTPPCFPDLQIQEYIVFSLWQRDNPQSPAEKMSTQEET